MNINTYRRVNIVNENSNLFDVSDNFITKTDELLCIILPVVFTVVDASYATAFYFR